MEPSGPRSIRAPSSWSPQGSPRARRARARPAPSRGRIPVRGIKRDEEAPPRDGVFGVAPLVHVVVIPMARRAGRTTSPGGGTMAKAAAKGGKKPFGGFSISFKGADDTLESVF